MTGKDPYKDLKHESNEMALGILPELRVLVEKAGDSHSKFRMAALIAARYFILLIDHLNHCMFY